MQQQQLLLLPGRKQQQGATAAHDPDNGTSSNNGNQNEVWEGCFLREPALADGLRQGYGLFSVEAACKGIGDQNDDI